MTEHKILILGEAWGEHEERLRTPFVGPSSNELTRMLTEAGIRRADCYLTNVFNLRPRPSNDIENLCGPKADAAPGREPIRAGKYIRAEFAGELQRASDELASIRPNLVVALGGTAAWFCLGSAGISRIRGTVAQGIHGLKILPTYHPAAILRDWSLRHVTVLDLMKAAKQQEFPEVRRPSRQIYIEPSLEDMEWFFNEHLVPAKRISFDIETAGNQITCIGFAGSISAALVVPIFDNRKPGNSFWPSFEAELLVWNFIRKVLDLPQPKLGQNGLYDIRFLWETYGIPVRNYDDDTMLLHHALQPESQKGLGFLGSVYTDEPAWKLMRKKSSTIKRDE